MQHSRSSSRHHGKSQWWPQLDIQVCSKLFNLPHFCYSAYSLTRSLSLSCPFSLSSLFLDWPARAQLVSTLVHTIISALLRMKVLVLMLLLRLCTSMGLDHPVQWGTLVSWAIIILLKIIVQCCSALTLSSLHKILLYMWWLCGA